MLDEFRLAYVRHREHDVEASPESAWSWLATNHALFPEARCDRVLVGRTSRSTRGDSRSPPASGRVEVRVDGAVVYADGAPTRVDAAEIRAKAAEAAQRLFARLETSDAAS